MTKTLPKPPIDPIAQNTETMLAFDEHENSNVSRHQKFLEELSEVFGSPGFLFATVCFVGLWIIVNEFSFWFHIHAFDPAPFNILQGIVSLAALITTIIVLIKQNRFGKTEQRRAHLELQVNLLTEQKVTKLINLIEELRRDLPMIQNRIDPEALAFQIPTDPESVLRALDDRKEGP